VSGTDRYVAVRNRWTTPVDHSYNLAFWPLWGRSIHFIALVAVVVLPLDTSDVWWASPPHTVGGICLPRLAYSAA